MFDRTIVISLRRRQDRGRHFLDQWALLSDQWDGEFVLTPGIDVQQCPPPAWWNTHIGAWGCYQSHVRAIERALNDGLLNLMVFEDDALLGDRLVDRTLDFLEIIPDDWDMLYLGGNHRGPTRPGKAPTKIMPGLYRCKEVLGTYAYAVSKRGMQRLYPRLFQGPPDGHNLHIDQLLAILHAELGLNVYAPTDWIVGHGATGVSDINGEQHTQDRWFHYRGGNLNGNT